MAGKLIKGNKKSFTTIDNSIFMDKRLGYKELGLLCQLLSLPDNWSFNVRGLASLHKDGKTSTATTLTNLIKLGYLYRDDDNRGRNEKGEFNTSIDYYIYDNPLDNPHYHLTAGNGVEQQEKDENEPMSGNQDVDSAMSGFPVVDNPVVDNQPQYNTNLINNEYIYKNLDSSTNNNSSFLFESNLNTSIEVADGLFVKEEWYDDVNKLIVDVGRRKIDGSKTSLLKYLYTLQERGWLDSKGNPIGSLYGYVKSNFAIRQKQNDKDEPSFVQFDMPVYDTSKNEEISDEEYERLLVMDDDKLPVYDTSKNKKLSDEEIERLLALRNVKPSELSH